MTVASAQRKPLLVMFYSPNIRPYQYLLDIVPNDGSTAEMLQQHVLVRVDANQLGGASLAST